VSLPVPSRPALVAAGLLVPLVVTSALSVVRDDVSDVNVVLALVLVVVAVAAGGCRVAGVVTALSSAAWFDFFFLPPYLTFTIDQRDDVETAVLLVLVGLAVTEIVLWGRRHQDAAGRRQGYLDGVVSATGLVAGGEAPDTVRTVVARQIAELLEVDACEYVDGPPTARPRLQPDGSVTRSGTVLDVDRTGLPTNDVLEVPVTRGGVAVGRFVLTATSRVVWTTPEQRRVAVVLADQAASALPATRA
jgi:K+-sensing histidine kinase KdpD